MRNAAVVLALLFLAGRAFAQEAIVLSAGGARALAHAGVLQELEARGHDPGIVAGTSMGAIVGALYAAGWSADSIATRIRQQDWREMFAPLPVPFAGVGGPRHPLFRMGSRGYLSDWRTNRELAQFLFEPSARARGDFDRLPRRLRVVAADIGTGEPVVLARGDLARAVRASVAQPGFFPFVDWGGRHLVDGAVRDYLPVDAARAAGARRVFASDTIRPRTQGADSAAFGVAQRSLDWLTVHGAVSATAPDVLFLPDVDPTTSPIVYPSDPEPFLRAGREAVARVTLPSPGGRGARPQQAAPARLGALAVEAGAYAPFLRRGFAPHAPADFDARAILSRIDRAYATGLFDAVWASVEDTLDVPRLIVRATPRKLQTVMAAVGFDNDRGGRAWLSLRRALSTGARPVDAALDGSLDGVVRSAALTLRAPTLAGHAWTLSGGISEAEPRGFEEVTRTGGAIGAEWRRIAPDAHAALSFRAENVEQAGAEGGSYGPELRAGAIAPLVQVVGIETRLDGTLRFGDVSYERGAVQASRAFGRRRWLAAPLAAFAAASDDAPLDAWPALGDDHLVPGLRWGDRRGQLLLAGGLDVARVLPKRTTLVVRLRGGRIEDRADGGEDGNLGGAALAMLWWLPIGRVELGYEGTTEGDRRAAVRLGASF